MGGLGFRGLGAFRGLGFRLLSDSGRLGCRANTYTVDDINPPLPIIVQEDIIIPIA